MLSLKANLFIIFEFNLFFQRNQGIDWRISNEPWYESRKLMAKHCYENAYKSKQLIKWLQKHTKTDILEPTVRFDQVIVFLCADIGNWFDLFRFQCLFLLLWDFLIRSSPKSFDLLNFIW